MRARCPAQYATSWLGTDHKRGRTTAGISHRDRPNARGGRAHRVVVPVFFLCMAVIVVRLSIRASMETSGKANAEEWRFGQFLDSVDPWADGPRSPDTFGSSESIGRSQCGEAGTRRCAIALEAGSRVIISSLDQRSCWHSVRLSWEPDYDGAIPPVGSGPTSRLDVVRLDRRCLAGFVIPRQPRPMPVRAYSCSPTRFSVSPERTFRLPYFTFGGLATNTPEISPCILERIARCRLILETNDLGIYSERSTHRSTVNRSVRYQARASAFALDTSAPAADNSATGIGESLLLADARKIAAEYSANVSPLVREILGPVADVDGDGRTTMVLCDLADVPPSGEMPVLGCVREADFLKPHSLSGDIIYLDESLASSDLLAAVLTHEIAHAAVFSILRRGPGVSTTGDRLPPWLNEAIAHSCEFERVPGSRNLSGRIERFLEAPHAFPLFASHPQTSVADARGPTRAAGLFFVQFLQSCDVHRSELLRTPGTGSQRVETVTGASFSEVFRGWTLFLLAQSDSGQAPLTIRTLGPTPATQSLQIRGTSAAWFVAECQGTLSFSRLDDSPMQVTVVAD